MSERLSVSFGFVAGLAAEFGAVECCLRERDHSFTDFVAEVWFESLPSTFTARHAVVIGYSVLVRSYSAGPFFIAVPLELHHALSLSY